MPFCVSAAQRTPGGIPSGYLPVGTAELLLEPSVLLALDGPENSAMSFLRIIKAAARAPTRENSFNISKVHPLCGYGLHDTLFNQI